MILQGRRKRGGKKPGKRKGVSKIIGILDTMLPFGPIAQQMCKVHFLDSQHSWVSTERACALLAAVLCSSAHLSFGLVSQTISKVCNFGHAFINQSFY